jgi:hypothetical protein
MLVTIENDHTLLYAGHVAKTWMLSSEKERLHMKMGRCSLYAPKVFQAGQE